MWGHSLFYSLFYLLFNFIFLDLLTHPVYVWMFVVIQPAFLAAKSNKVHKLRESTTMLQVEFSAIRILISCCGSHTRTVVRECYKNDGESLWKSPKFDPSPRWNHVTDRPQNLQAWLPPLYLPQRKILSRSDEGFFLPMAHMGEISLLRFGNYFVFLVHNFKGGACIGQVMSLHIRV